MSRNEWTTERMLEAIRQWHEKGMLPAKAHGMTRQTWTEERVIAVIRSRYQQGSLTTAWTTDTRLYSAAGRYFGRWSHALQAAGCLTQRHRRWSDSSVIAAIQARHRQGLPLRFESMDDRGLRDAAASRFGSWRKAVRAAGLESALRRAWSKTAVIEAIQAWRRQGREIKDIMRKNPNLYSAARKHFGRWATALAAAGYEWPARREWSRERVMAELRRLDSIPGMCIWTHDNALVTAANRYFGSLRQARVAAGLDPTHRASWQRQVIEAIQDQYVRGTLARYQADCNSALRAAATKHFGSWEKALAAAGLNTRTLLPRNETKSSRKTA